MYKYLVKIRKQKGYTIMQMAEQLNISDSVYLKYESGTEMPDLEMLVKISDVLSCSLDDLVGRISMSNHIALRESETPYNSNSEKALDKKLAIGVQDFRSLRESGGYYVDKTQLIWQFLESGYQVTLVTRPRRFGKTLNMSMLAEFLDCTKNSSDVFAGTKVCVSIASHDMNQNPVIFLSFLNVKGDTSDRMLFQLMSVIECEYQKYLPIIQSGKLPETQREKLEDVYRCLAKGLINDETKGWLILSISILCQALMGYYGKKVYLLIDEYDTPFIAANAGRYYDEVREILSGMLSSSLKGNRALEKAMLTGIQRVAKENIFSGLNNLTVCTVNDWEYSDCFGFTEEETRELLQCYGLQMSEDVKAMYDGYRFGCTQIYNPWSVTSYAARKRLAPYWVNTSENTIIRNAIAQSSNSFISDYERLIEEGTAFVPVEMETSYYEQPDDASLWGLLVHAGMLTMKGHIEENIYSVKIPNHEVLKAFQNLTAFYLGVQEGHITKMLMYLKRGCMEDFSEEYQNILLELPSYHDLKSENSYHMMMLGMCAFMYKDYDVRSNREKGKGRSDILLYARKAEHPHMILEFKYTKDESQNLKKLAQDAINQIKEKKYDADLAGDVYFIGLAHFGKNVEVLWSKNVK